MVVRQERLPFVSSSGTMVGGSDHKGSGTVFRWSGKRSLWIFVLTLLLLFGSGPIAARADVALCGSYPIPSDARPLRLAPVAFDGVVVGGRPVDDPKRESAFVSPLFVRVTRWVKSSLHPGAAPSGVDRVTLWDGRYARLPERVLRKASRQLVTRFPGEITAFRGQAWRFYATEENGIAFTCMNLLGSHPVKRSAPSPSSSSGSAFPWGIALGVGVFGVTLAGLVVWRLRGRP